MEPDLSPVKVIEKARALGFSLSDSVQRAIGRPLAAFAAENDWARQEVSMCLRNTRPYPVIRDALAAELRTTRAKVDALIETASGEAAVA